MMRRLGVVVPGVIVVALVSCARGTSDEPNSARNRRAEQSAASVSPGPSSSSTPVGAQPSPGQVLGRTCSGGRSPASKPCVEFGEPERAVGTSDGVSWVDAERWWRRHGNLLRAPNTPKGRREAIYALPPGIRGSSMEHKAAVAVFYLPDNLSPERQSLWELLDGGAMHLEARYYEAGADDVPFQGPTWTDREIDVRGTKGQLAELRKNSHGAGKNWRMIRWAEPSKIGGTVRWIAGTHPDLYSFEEALAFVDALILAS